MDVTPQDREQPIERKENPGTAKHHEIADLEIEKSHAAKGDESDGRVDWTWKQILATISLCGVYVGMSSRHPCLIPHETRSKSSPGANRFTNPSLFCWR